MLEKGSEIMSEYKMTAEQWERFFQWLSMENYDKEVHGAIWWWLADKLYAWKLKLAFEGITKKVD